jgi:pyridoxamine 5'-phosphate oxidase
MVKSARRVEFERFAFSDDEVLANPFSQFSTWWKDAEKAQVNLIDAAHLATTDENLHPDLRVVFIKDFSEDGFVFFTNYASRKGKQLQNAPYGALNIFWPELERQIRIKGEVKKTSRQISENYFSSRPRGAQIGAWASSQSQVIENRNDLLRTYEEFSQQFLNREVPCPPGWGGFCLDPNYFEFWQGRKNRLHDRICFLKENLKWRHQRLAP